jgi:tetratricopeptide (TPR) repeat protein
LLVAGIGVALLPLLRHEVAAPDSHTSEGEAPENFSMSLQRPMVAVLTSDPDAEADAARLRAMLARFDDLVTVSRDNRHASPDKALSYELELRRENDRLRLSLVRLPEAVIIWTRDLANADSDVAQIAQLATEIAQPYGVLFADLRRGLGPTGAVGCGVIAMDYWLSYRADRHAPAVACLRRLASEPLAAAAVHANLAMLLVEGYRRRWLADDRATLDDALTQARRAVEVAPASSRARQALAAAHFVRGERGQGLAEARAAVALNPFDMDVLADLGARLIQAGETAEGLRHLGRSMTGAAVTPPWRLFYLWLGERTEGQAEAARRQAALLTTEDFPLGLAARLVEAKAAGDEAERSRLSARLQDVAPAFLADPVAGLARRGFAPEVAERLGGLIREARPPRPQG